MISVREAADLMISMTDFKIIPYLILTVGLLINSGCSSPTAVLDETQTKQWKEDTDGCKGNRAAILPVLEPKLESIKGSDEMDIKRMFGLPDYTDLYKRSEKYYIYYIEPGPDCEPGANKKVLSVRFSAINKVNEIIITRK